VNEKADKEVTGTLDNTNFRKKSKEKCAPSVLSEIKDHERGATIEDAGEPLADLAECALTTLVLGLGVRRRATR
jgi:hypothetical protein